MKIGTIIKAYDFNTTDKYYMEGRITSVCEETKTFTVKTTDVVRDGKSCEFGEVLGNDTFTTPMLGYSYSDQKERFYFNGDELIMSPDQSRIVEVA